MRLAAHGEARWLLAQGEFTYGEFDLQSVSTTAARRQSNDVRRGEYFALCGLFQSIRGQTSPSQAHS